MNDIYFEKVWAMPNGNTFTIKPIKEFVEAEVNKGGVIIDPFANTCKYGTITNDLNPDGHTLHDYDERFQWEDEGFWPEGKSFKWKDLEEPQYNFEQIIRKETNKGN